MQVRFVKDITNLKDIDTFNYQCERVIDYLIDKYPLGVNSPYTIFLNDKKLEVNDFDTEVSTDDVLTFIMHPKIAAAFGLTGIAAYLVNFAVATAISYAVGQIFKPDVPDIGLGSSQRSNNKQSSVYNLNSQQNVQRLGQPIPVHYGRVRVYPSLLEAPYYRYEDNEQYLYQLMCIGAGKYRLNDIFVSDTTSSDISTETFQYETIYESSFANIENAIGDASYHQRVRTVPEVSTLEVRGTPQKSEMYLSFSGSTITFGQYNGGVYPDISSLALGSQIIISNSDSNDGTYTVQSVDLINHTVTVQSHVFTTEPATVTSATNTDWARTYGRTIYEDLFNSNSELYFFSEIGKVYKIEFNGLTYIGVPTYRIEEGQSDSSEVGFDINFEKFGFGTITMTNDKTICNATFDTTYGEFTLNTATNSLPQKLEIDLVLPRGLYNTNSSTGVFEDRVLSLQVITKAYRNGSNFSTSATQISYTEKDSSPFRFTESLLIPLTIQQGDILKVSIKRTTGEPSGNRSSDMVIMESLKYIEVPPNSESFGDLTLLWVKAKATNGLSAISQFQINAWVTRIDNISTIKDSITDIYTNTDYGAGLSESDLLLPSTTEEFNGTLDKSMPVYDAIKMIAKAGRYIPYLDGAILAIRKDQAQPIRNYVFNETNIVKESLKIDYLFGQEDGFDGVRVKYRRPTDFKEDVRTYPTNSVNPEVMELIGCTDETIALNEATYGYKQKESRKKILSFKTDIQGVIPNYLDRIGISHNMVKWGQGGQVAFKNGVVVDVVINYDLTANVDNYDTIIFIRDTGEVSDPLTFTVIGDQQILLDNPLTFGWIYWGYEYDKTPFSMGSSNNIIRDYIVTSVSPSPDGIVDIKAINYDDSIYDQSTNVWRDTDTWLDTNTWSD